MTERTLSAEALLTAIRHAPGGLAAVVEAEWARHAAYAQPVVTLFGVYDAGKSSLLKRLLAEDDLPIPDWLTISGGPETFEVNEVGVLGCMLRDTPGICAGREQHAPLAFTAARDSDAILILMPPTLLTSEKHKVLDLVSGRTFHPNGMAWQQDAVSLIIGRLDDAGIDPAVDGAGYLALAAAKVAELRSLLERDESKASAIQILPIAADPYQRTKRQPQVCAKDYDASRHWDGMGELGAWLTALPAKLPDLRRAAELRFLAFYAWSIDERLREQIESQEANRDAQAQVLERLDGALSRLSAACAASRAGLESVVEETLLRASRTSVGSEPDAARQDAEARLDEAIDAWLTEQRRNIEKLATELEAELRRQCDRPAVHHLLDFLRPRTADGGNQGKPDDTDAAANFNVLRNAVPLLDTAFRQGIEAYLGQNIGELRGELERLRRFKTFEGYAAAPSDVGKSGFRTEGDATKAKWATGIHSIATVLTPSLIELGALIYTHVKETRAREERAKRRQQLHEEILESAKAVGDRVWEHWQAIPEQLRQELTTQRTSSARQVAAWDHQLGELARARESLARALGTTETSAP